MLKVWIDDNDYMNKTVAFRCIVDKLGNNSKLKLAASNLYRIFINGEFIGYGPARAAHGYTRVDNYDLSSYAGEKAVITIEVFSSGINTFYIVDEKPFFAAEITENEKTVYNTDDFMAFLVTDRKQKVQRFSFQRSFVESYSMTCDRNAFYLGDDGVFKKMSTVEVAGNELIERLVSYPKLNYLNAGESIRKSGAKKTETPKEVWRDRSLTDIGPKLKGYTIDELTECLSDEICSLEHTSGSAGAKAELYDFGRAVTGFFKIDVSVSKKTVMYIVWDEILNSDGEINPFRNDCCNALKYELAPGDYGLLSFEANTSRYFEVLIFGDAIINNAGMVLYENPDALDILPDTDDSELLEIFEGAKNTFVQNAVDILIDCPSRERAGWLCDTYFSSRAERLFTGKSVVEKSFLENYIMYDKGCPIPEGMLPMCYPADTGDEFIPNWAMWFILELKSYFAATGDSEMITRAKPKVYALFDYFKTFLNEENLLENLESWVFVEWSKCNDPEYTAGVNFPSNILYSAALSAAGELYSDITLTELAQKVAESVRKYSYNGEFFEDNCIRINGRLERQGHITETCQYYAFYFGIANKSQYPDLYSEIIEKFGPTRDVQKIYPQVCPSNAFIGDYLRLELLMSENLYADVIRDCKDYFLGMVRTTGTLWEMNSPTASLVHCFASVAAVYIYECSKQYKAV